jgi:hypothetical protein
MKKYATTLISLLCVIYSTAENRPTGKSNPNYKNLKVYAKVLERSGSSDFYSIQIDIVNIGKSTVSFLEEASSYSWTFAFSASGVIFVNETVRMYLEKKIPNIPTVTEVEKKINILPHQKYTIKTQFFIKDRVRFLKTNNNLRVIFLYNDANLQLMTDVKKIVCQDSIVYKW